MLLAIDTSTGFAGLALYGEDGPVASSTWRAGRMQTVQLMPAIDEMLHRANVSRVELTGVGVATGPGSFTSVRVALATAKGLAMSLQLPLIGIPTLLYTAWPQRHRGLPIRACLPLGRRRIAVAAYSACGLDPEWIRNFSPDEVSEEGSLLYCGEITSELAKVIRMNNEEAVILPPAEGMRNPTVLAELAWGRLSLKDYDSYSLQAEYLDPR